MVGVKYHSIYNDRLGAYLDWFLQSSDLKHDSRIHDLKNKHWRFFLLLGA